MKTIALIYLIYISMDIIIALLRCSFLATLLIIRNLAVSGSQSFVISCMCIVSSIGWNIYTLTGVD